MTWYPMPLLKAIAIYFALAFGAGFVFGTVHVPLLVPMFGERIAVLIEAPFMLVAIALAARFVSRRVRGSSGERLVVGLASAALVLVADIGVGVALGGLSVAESLFARDAIAGAAYYALLGVFAVAPWAWGRQAEPTRGEASRGRPTLRRPRREH